MKIYVASSWRDTLQPEIVQVLRAAGHEVYDFRNPAPGNSGFSWSTIDPNWQNWTPAEYRAALQHPIAKAGYKFDIDALKSCDICVLVLPSGRSASWEFGYAMGQGKRGIVAQFDAVEPELMYREADIATSMAELVELVAATETTPEQIRYKKTPEEELTRSRLVSELVILDDSFRWRKVEVLDRKYETDVLYHGQCGRLLVSVYIENKGLGATLRDDLSNTLIYLNSQYAEVLLKKALAYLSTTNAEIK